MATSSITAGHTQKSCAITQRVDAYGVFQSVYSIFILAQFLEYSSTLQMTQSVSSLAWELAATRDTARIKISFSVIS